MIKKLFTAGEFIREKRLEKKITQKELATKICISPQYMNDIEHDRRTPSNSVIESFVRFFKIDGDYLFYLCGKFPHGFKNISEDDFNKAIFAFANALIESQYD